MTNSDITRSLPKTAVPAGIADPVASARAELKAALAAIEVKGNFPRRIDRASKRGIAKARVFADRNPAAAVAGAVGAAIVVGGVVWALATVVFAVLALPPEQLYVVASGSGTFSVLLLMFIASAAVFVYFLRKRRDAAILRLNEVAGTQEEQRWA